MASRLRLPDVTLCCIDTRHPALAQAALARSMHQIDFGEVLLITLPGTEASVPGLSVIGIEAIRSTAEYSRFVLRDLGRLVATRHVLIVQWDGWVLSANHWDDRFLRYDYIGAPWSWFPSDQNVGNGGFSLRSRALLQYTARQDWPDAHPEDRAIATRRTELQAAGLTIAPLEVARRFAFEHSQDRRTFGFHGPFNLPAVLDETALRDLIGALPDDFFETDASLQLARGCVRGGERQHANARRILRRRVSRLGWHVPTWFRSDECSLRERLTVIRECLGLAPSAPRIFPRIPELPDASPEVQAVARSRPGRSDRRLPEKADMVQG